jgi:hypothetical protein
VFFRFFRKRQFFIFPLYLINSVILGVIFFCLSLSTRCCGMHFGVGNGKCTFLTSPLFVCPSLFTSIFLSVFLSVHKFTFVVYLNFCIFRFPFHAVLLFLSVYVSLFCFSFFQTIRCHEAVTRVTPRHSWSRESDVSSKT